MKPSVYIIETALSAFGLVVIKSTGDAWLAVWLQLSLFLTPVVANDAMARFKAEPFLALASLMVMAVVVATVRRSDSTTRDSVLLGLACGFGHEVHARCRSHASLDACSGPIACSG